MPVVQILPLTTVANSTALLRHPDGPYIPYDFSGLTNFELVFGLFIKHWQFLLAVVAFYSTIQLTAPFLLRAAFGKKFTSLSKKKQSDLAIAFCSIVNCIVSSRTAYLFVRTFVEHGYTFHNYHYQEIEGYEFTRLMIVGYFLWDVVVCVLFQWGFAWTAHGAASFCGTYLLAFPISDHMSTYFTGMFELTNGFLHTASLLRAVKAYEGVATILEYIFGLTYFLIRVCGGTYVTYNWVVEMTALIHTGKSHSPVCIVLMITFLLIIMVLQYVWFWEIIQTALGWKTHGAGAPDTAPLMGDAVDSKKTSAGSASASSRRRPAKRED